MIFWRWLLYTMAVYSVAVGLWDHDWRMILAGFSVGLIYPMISADIEGDEERGFWDV